MLRTTYFVCKIYQSLTRKVSIFGAFATPDVQAKQATLNGLCYHVKSPNEICCPIQHKSNETSHCTWHKPNETSSCSQQPLSLLSLT